TRAKHRCHIWFVSNRRIHGLWQATLPSRFLDELPETHFEVAEMEQSYGGYGRGGYGQSRFDKGFRQFIEETRGQGRLPEAVDAAVG
ncbi:hypothetical protein ACC692_37485, partial [Rhizobium ruizarguesonis]